MATGASTADLAIVLIDARNGVLPQSRRHAFIAALLGIPHIVVAVNKMDLVDFSREVFERIREEFGEHLRAAWRLPDAHFIPISALEGDNVVDPEPADALVSRRQPARAPGERAGSAARRVRPAALPGAVRAPAGRAFPGLCGPGGLPAPSGRAIP